MRAAEKIAGFAPDAILLHQTELVSNRVDQ